MILLRRIRRFFAGQDRRPSRHAARYQTEAFEATRVIVRCYYVVLLFFAAATMDNWPFYADRSDVLPLWPVVWLHAAPLRAGVLGILIGYLATTFLGAFFSNRRWARGLTFLGLLEFVAMENSFGKINHAHHLWVLTAFLLVFLPDVTDTTADRATRQRFLAVFWACQAITLLTYTMSGLGKVICAAYQVCAGQTNLLMPSGLATLIASRLLQTSSNSWLGPWVIAHPWLGWPLGLTSVYLEFFAFWVAFRPALFRWWAAGLILFHVMVYLCMAVGFMPVIWLLGLLFLATPPRPEDRSILGAARQLPVISLVLKGVLRGL